MKELTYSELKQLKPGSYILIDTRDSGSILYGMIPGAIHIPEQELWADLWKYTSEAPSEKTLILYCQRGVLPAAKRDYNELHFLQFACHFTETCTTCHEDGTTSSKRLETKKLIAELKKTNPQVEANIFNSVSNVNLSTVIAYKEDGVKHHFLDSYI